MKIGACFGCWQTGHMVTDCPKRHNNAISTQAEEIPRKKPRVHGRVFAMTKQDAEASNDVVTSTLSQFSRDAKVLFDSGAAHSFMSIAFACRANKNTEPLGCHLFVATPMGDNMILNQVYKSCLLSFGDRKFSADLLLILMHDFEHHSGMDWLATYHANVDCFSKEIMFKIPREIKFCFQGNQNNYRGLISDYL
ncbi:hypothetical protein AB3S75_031587 [Citrus x aurantiifolia]